MVNYILMMHKTKLFSQKMAAVCLMLTSLLLVSCKDEQVEQELPLRSVKAMEISSAGDSRNLSFPGVVKSSQEAKLSFKVSGTLVKRNVTIGDDIKQGDVVAELDPLPYQLRLEQAQSDLERAQSDYRNAQSSYNRTRQLYENQSASKNELDDARAQFESTQAQVNSARRSVELARLNVEYTQLLAEDDCQVASTSADVGENVNIAQEIVAVNCGSELKVEVSVPQSSISLFNLGLPADVTLDALPGKVYRGRVNETGQAALGTTFPVSVKLDDPKDLRVGLTAQALFTFSNETNWFVIPAPSVGSDSKGEFVFLLTPGSEEDTRIVKRQSVVAGNLVAEGVEVKDGVTIGDQIVVAGLSVLQDGMEVKAPTRLVNTAQ